MILNLSEQDSAQVIGLLAIAVNDRVALDVQAGNSVGKKVVEQTEANEQEVKALKTQDYSDLPQDRIGILLTRACGAYFDEYAYFDEDTSDAMKEVRRETLKCMLDAHAI